MKKPQMSLSMDADNILDFTIALFICAPEIREVLKLLFPSASAMTAAILYGFLFLYFAKKGIRPKEWLKILVPVGVLFLLLSLTWLLYPERRGFYWNGLYKIWELAFPIYTVYITVVCLLQKDSVRFINSFKIVAFFLLAYYLVEAIPALKAGYWLRESIYNGKKVWIKSSYNLTWGYGMFLPCTIFGGLFILEKKRMYLLMVSIGLCGIFLLGSRGPLAMYALFVMLLLAFYSQKNVSKRITVLMMFVFAIAILWASGVLQSFLLLVFRNLNISSRTIEKLLNGSISDMSGRPLIYKRVIEKILQSPLWGWGIFSDRFFLNLFVQGGSAYSHNVFLEICISFGVFGLLFIIWMLYRIVYIMKYTMDIRVRVVVLICVGACLPLLLSLTFWWQPMFWVLLAILINQSVRASSRLKGKELICQETGQSFF